MLWMNGLERQASEVMSQGEWVRVLRATTWRQQEHTDKTENHQESIWSRELGNKKEKWLKIWNNDKGDNRIGTHRKRFAVESWEKDD